MAFQRKEWPPSAWGLTGRDHCAIIRGPEEGKTHIIWIPNCAMRTSSQMVFKLFFQLRYLPFYRWANWDWGKWAPRISCHLCQLELVFGGPKEPWSWSLTYWLWHRHSCHTGKIAIGHPQRHLHSPSIVRTQELIFFPLAYIMFTGSWLTIKSTVRHVDTRCAQHCIQLCFCQL